MLTTGIGIAGLLAAAGAFIVGYYQGRSGKAAAVEAAELRIIASLQEQGHVKAVEAIRARRIVERDFDRGVRKHDDPHRRD